MSMRDGNEIFILTFYLFQTPLHIAVENGKKEIVEILIQNGGDINSKDVRTLTLLCVCVCILSVCDDV